jgi:hypothetical protein
MQYLDLLTINHFLLFKITYLVIYVTPTLNMVGYIHSQRSQLIQGPSALKGLRFITFETWFVYFDWGLL